MKSSRKRPREHPRKGHYRKGKWIKRTTVNKGVKYPVKRKKEVVFPNKIMLKDGSIYILEKVFDNSSDAWELAKTGYRRVETKGGKYAVYYHQQMMAQKTYKPYNRNEKAEDLIENVFNGDYKEGWEALWRQESNYEFKKSFDYIARMNDLPSEVRNTKLTNRWELAELLEKEFGNNYESLFKEYVRQMSNDDFKEADSYIRRMYQ